MKSDDGTYEEEPTGELPVVHPVDSRITITGAAPASEIAEPVIEVDEVTMLPHWTEAPTGQVPAVLAREMDPNEIDDPWASIPAPSWREGEADWVANDEQFDASVLASETVEEDSRPWEFVLPEDEVVEEEILDEAPRPEPTRAERVRRPVRANPLEGRAVRSAPSGRNLVLATFTGLAIAAVVCVIFLVGTIPVAILCTVVLAAAAAEAFASFRSVGAHPATILGIVGVATLGVATYNKGQAALGLVTVLFIIFGFVWYLSAETKFDVLDGLGATLFVYLWIGIMGSYALLLISPRSFPDKHGLAFLFGAILLTVTNDSSALFIGRAFGKRPLAPSISPSKTIGGAVGATVVTLIVAVGVMSRISPWTHRTALAVGIAICIVAPLGDLFESMVKRTLGLKDMGTVLPGHGGILDRVDGLIFALPTTYYLVHVLHLR